VPAAPSGVPAATPGAVCPDDVAETSETKMDRSTQCIDRRYTRTRGYNLEQWIVAGSSRDAGHVYSAKTAAGKTKFIRQEAIARARIIAQLNPSRPAMPQ
jgi:hypothetical protein